MRPWTRCDESLVCDLGDADRNGAIEKLAGLMESGSYISNADSLVTAALEREAILSTGVPARLSEGAGRFVCNALLYSALYRLEQADDPIPAAFIHVPATPEMGLDVPTLILDQIVTALIAAIQAI